MKITSIRCAAVKDPSKLGRTRTPSASTELQFMNPIASMGPGRGRASRFEPPWGEAICMVKFDTGDWGVGLTGACRRGCSADQRLLGPMILGESVTAVDDIVELWDVMATVLTANIGIGGVGSYAISAVDLALYDGLGKRLGAPVFELLGGPACRELDCYATGADVQRLVDFGFTAFKIPCPWPDDSAAAVDRVVAAFDEACSIAGVDAKVMIDCWAVMDVDAAVRIGEAFGPERTVVDRGLCQSAGLDWLRGGPSPSFPMLGSRRVSVGSLTNRSVGMRKLGTIDVVQPDPLWVGRCHPPTVRIAKIAAEHDLDMAIHCAANDAFGQHLAYRAQAEHTLAEMYIGAADEPCRRLSVDSRHGDSGRRRAGAYRSSWLRHRTHHRCDRSWHLTRSARAKTRRGMLRGTTQPSVTADVSEGRYVRAVTSRFYGVAPPSGLGVSHHSWVRCGPWLPQGPCPGA